MKYYMNEWMNEIFFKQLNIVNEKLWENEFDLVFSIHVLEQLPYEAKDAILNMIYCSSNIVILIEPDWNLSNALERLYIIENDHVRCIFDSIKKLWYEPVEYYKSHIQSCIYNPSIVTVIKK